MFPVSSLGHTVLVPGWLGWHNLVHSESASESFYLAFVTGLHVATALSLIVIFWRDWVRIIGGLLTSIRDRKVETPAQRLGWLLVIATIPAGIVGLAFEHALRTQFAKPLSAAVFLTINGGILLVGERLRRRDAVRVLAAEHGEVTEPGGISSVGVDPAGGGPRRRLDTLEIREAGVIGIAQILPLLAGISRSGVTMVAGLLRGLDHENATALLVPARNPDHLCCGSAEGARSDGIARKRGARPDPRRLHLRGCDRVPLGAFLTALLRDEDAHTVRHLLPDRRRRVDRQVRLTNPRTRRLRVTPPLRAVPRGRARGSARPHTRGHRLPAVRSRCGSP